MFDITDSNVNNQYSQMYYIMSNDYLNDSKEIFDKIIYNNPKVKMVICGHCVSGNYIECIDKKKRKRGEYVLYNGELPALYRWRGWVYWHPLLKDGIPSLRSYNTFNKTYGNVNISFESEL